ncbi:glucose-1-phosphate cytidylyltransferase [Oligoflexia bacterium]|nr:glucose-1-phosphate cytidylyltransferase [Oligoflexia bacterium]
MKVILLAGGFGTRLGSLTESIPKPMIRIGAKPILWHIMKTYSHFGYRDFVLSLGYKAEVIKDFFYNYRSYSGDFSIELGSGEVAYLNQVEEADWKVTLVDTGYNSLKGARIKRVEQYLDEVNMVTYGDGVADIDIKKLLAYHNSHDKLLTITAVHPPARFGEIIEEKGRLVSFNEKPQISEGLINGGYMVFDRKLLDYLSTDESCDFEYEVFDTLVEKDQIRVYQHLGRWECIDHERDLIHLNHLWREGKAFWKVWN